MTQKIKKIQKIFNEKATLKKVIDELSKDGIVEITRIIRMQNGEVVVDYNIDG